MTQPKNRDMSLSLVASQLLRANSLAVFTGRYCCGRVNRSFVKFGSNGGTWLKTTGRADAWSRSVLQDHFFLPT